MVNAASRNIRAASPHAELSGWTSFGHSSPFAPYPPVGPRDTSQGEAQNGESHHRGAPVAPPTRPGIHATEANDSNNEEGSEADPDRGAKAGADLVHSPLWRWRVRWRREPRFGWIPLPVRRLPPVIAFRSVHIAQGYAARHRSGMGDPPDRRRSQGPSVLSAEFEKPPEKHSAQPEQGV